MKTQKNNTNTGKEQGQDQKRVWQPPEIVEENFSDTHAQVPPPPPTAPGQGSS